MAQAPSRLTREGTLERLSKGLRPAIIEKDYYVTIALRAVAASASDKVIFKGGTSLAKGSAISQSVGGCTDSPLILHSFAPLFLTKPFLQIFRGS